MDRTKIFHLISAILLVMLFNEMVNLSDNLYMGLRYPELYFSFVIVGLIGSITIQIYGAYKLLGIIEIRLKDTMREE